MECSERADEDLDDGSEDGDVHPTDCKKVKCTGCSEVIDDGVEGFSRGSEERTANQLKGLIIACLGWLNGVCECGIEANPKRGRWLLIDRVQSVQVHLELNAFLA